MNISIIEFGVFGFFAYTGMLMLIISIIKKMPTTRSLAIVRAIYLTPSIIASGILASSGVNITYLTVTTSNTIRSLNTSQVWTESTTQTTQFTLLNNIWIPFHFMLFIIMVIFMIQQILFLLTKHGEDATQTEE